MNKKFRFSLLVTLILVLGLAIAIPVSAQSSGIFSPTDGAIEYGLKPVKLQYVTGYSSSNRTTFCKMKVYNTNGTLIHNQDFQYDKMYTKIESSFLPSSYGKYVFEAYEFFYLDGTDIPQTAGRRHSTSFTVVEPTNFNVVNGKFTLKTNHKGKVTIALRTKDATGHIVYRATKKNGKYKKIKSTTKSTYSNTGLGQKKYWYKIKPYIKVNGKTYYYKVRPYIKYKGKIRYAKYTPVKHIKANW